MNIYAVINKILENGVISDITLWVEDGEQVVQEISFSILEGGTEINLIRNKI